MSCFQQELNLDEFVNSIKSMNISMGISRQDYQEFVCDAMSNVSFLHDFKNRYDCLFRVAKGTRERSFVFLGCNTLVGLLIMFIGMRIIQVLLVGLFNVEYWIRSDSKIRMSENFRSKECDPKFSDNGTFRIGPLTFLKISDPYLIRKPEFFPDIRSEISEILKSDRISEILNRIGGFLDSLIWIG